MCSDWKLIHLLRQSTHNIDAKQNHNQAAPEQVKTSYNTDDWVAAVYYNEWYILGRYWKPTTKTFNIHFMRSSEKFPELFKWPLTSDDLWIPRGKILCHIGAPEQSVSSKHLFKLSENDKLVVEDKFETYVTTVWAVFHNLLLEEVTFHNNYRNSESTNIDSWQNRFNNILANSVIKMFISII